MTRNDPGIEGEVSATVKHFESEIAPKRANTLKTKKPIAGFYNNHEIHDDVWNMPLGKSVHMNCDTTRKTNKKNVQQTPSIEAIHFIFEARRKHSVDLASIRYRGDREMTKTLGGQNLGTQEQARVATDSNMAG